MVSESEVRGAQQRPSAGSGVIDGGALANGGLSGIRPERFFLVASLAFGLLLCFLTPPFAVPDEPAHWFRAWSATRSVISIARGGAAIPRSYLRLATTALQDVRGTEGHRFRLARIAEYARIPLAAGDQVFLPFPTDAWRQPLLYTAGSYSPFGYVAAAAAIVLCRILDLPPILHLYAVRIANLLLASALIALSIRRAPFGRWTIALCALLPMSMYLRTSASLDVLTIAVSFVVIGEALRFAFTPGQEITPLLLATTALGLVKPGYFFVPLLVLIAPPLRRRWGSMVAVSAAIVGSSALARVWATPPLQGATSLPLHPAMRLSAALHHPLAFAGAFALNWSESLTIRLTEMVGTFGWLDAPMPWSFVLIVLIGLAVVAHHDGPAPDAFRGVRRLLPALLFAATLFVITLVTHIYSPDGKFALAIQGRYFLPALPLALLPLARGEEPPRWMAGLACALVVLFDGQTLFTELLRFYV